MGLEDCRKEVAFVINDYVKRFGARKKIKTTGEIIKLLEDKGVELDTMFQVPDMCYNKTNKANLKSFRDDIKLFEFVSRGKYYILGEDYKYNGEVVWSDSQGKERIVGRWKDGILSYNGDSI